MLLRAYLQASTVEQDATRAREQLEAFAAERGLRIAGWYVENESGAKLAAPNSSGCSPTPGRAISWSSSRLTGSAACRTPTGSGGEANSTPVKSESSRSICRRLG